VIRRNSTGNPHLAELEAGSLPARGNRTAGARVELWPEIAGQGHPDAQRATVLTGADGGYRFQSDPPEHIHMLVSAEGFEPLASNRYHPEGRASGRFDILLTPARS
jgi:hypothetical protein